MNFVFNLEEVVNIDKGCGMTTGAAWFDRIFACALLKSNNQSIYLNLRRIWQYYLDTKTKEEIIKQICIIFTHEAMHHTINEIGKEIEVRKWSYSVAWDNIAHRLEQYM